MRRLPCETQQNWKAGKIMEYSFEEKEGILIFKLKGDLIGENNGPQLMNIAQDKVNDGIFYCAIDISELRYINSSGIGVLITLLTKFRNKNGEVVLINPSQQVKKLLIITKLNAIFSVVDTMEEAMSQLKIA